MNIKSLKEIVDDKTLPPDQIIGDGILLHKSLLLIAGEPKAKKSMLVYNMAIALASGSSFIFCNILKSQKVLVLTAEGGYYPNRDRLTKMISTIGVEDKSNLYVCFDPRLKIDDDADYNKIKNLLITFKPNVLVIDPLVKFHHKDENSAREMNIVLERIRNLIEDHNISIILLHHLGKNPLNGARGSSAILGEYDSCITIHKDDKQGRHRCEFDFRHAISLENTYIKFNENSHWFEYTESSVVKVLRDYGSMIKKDLVDILIVDEHYKRNTSAYRAIDNEIKKGTITLDQEEKYRIKSDGSGIIIL